MAHVDDLDKPRTKQIVLLGPLRFCFHRPPRNCKVSVEIIQKPAINGDRKRPFHTQNQRVGTCSGRTTYTWKEQEDVRNKILKRPHKGIYLNSAVYHGSRELGFQISLQHKFSDERNIALHTHKMLPDEKRRARVELELHGVSRLKEHGICTVNDLSKTNFRSVISEFCSFKLPVMRKSGTVLQEYIDVFGLRGCCGTSLYAAVKDFDDREKLKASKTVPRKTENQTSGLEPWREMNILTGRALDQLSRTWKKFSWP